MTTATECEPTFVGKRIRKLIAERGLAMCHVASAIGVHFNTVRSWTSGRTDPSARHVRRLCVLLKVSPMELLDLHESEIQ